MPYKPHCLPYRSSERRRGTSAKECLSLMDFLQYIPVLELLFFNLLTIDRCCHKKYSAKVTAMVLFLFSAAFFGISYHFAQQLSFRGDGRLSAGGFLFMIPMRFLYRERPPLLFTIICTCWTYTLGIMALSFQIGGLIAPGNVFYILAAESGLFLVTLFPFYRIVVPKYIFVIENLERFDRDWYKYIILNNSLNFLLLVVLNALFLADGSSVLRIIALAMLLALTYVSYFTLFRVVLNPIRLSQMEHAASHDPLTGLGNRKQLWDHLQGLLDAEQTFAVLFMDLDRFKTINDQYGHMVGDRYLKHFAAVCTQVLGNSGQVYRFGGDEFAAIYYGTIPQKILDEIKKCPRWNAGAPCPFRGVSVGVLRCQPPHQDVEQILRQADRIMYENKVGRG